jgi:hypothetical protein
MTAAAVFKLPDARSASWFPYAPLLFILCCVIVGAMILMRDPMQALLGILVVGIGHPLHWHRRRTNPAGEQLAPATTE